jgi:hypothetical protein
VNIYDRQVAISGGTLHHLGLLLAKEAGAARAQARPTSSTSLFLASPANRAEHSPSLQFAAPVAAAQAGCLPNQVNYPLRVCAWCDREAGTVRARSENVTHGICERHFQKEISKR